MASTTFNLVYFYRPATAHEQTPRITVDIRIDTFQGSAFVDTGGMDLILGDSQKV